MMIRKSQETTKMRVQIGKKMNRVRLSLEENSRIKNIGGVIATYKIKTRYRKFIEMVKG